MFKWILGLLLGSCVLAIQPTTLTTLFAITLITVALVLLFLQNHSKQTLLSAGVVLLSGFLIGLGWTSIHASWRLSQQIPSPENQSEHIIEAELKSLPAIYPEYCQFRVAVIKTDSHKLLSKKLLLKDYSKLCQYELGEIWSMTIKLKPIHGPINQAGFDYEFFMFQQGIDGKGYIKSAEKIESVTSFSVPNLRQTIFNSLQKYSNAGLLQALIIGEKTSIPQDDKTLLQNLGLSHLIAISGLHISIIAGFGFLIVFKILGWLNQVCRRKVFEPLRPAVVTSCFIALLYTALADFSLPTIRALIMWSCVAGALLLQRQSALFSGVKISLGLIMLLDPLSIISASFWMSYIAVMVISIVLAGRVMPQTGFLAAVRRLGKIQVAISLTLILPSLFFFQQATLLGLLINIIVIPVFSLLLLPAIMTAAILDFIGVTDSLMFWLDTAITQFITLGHLLEKSFSGLSFSLYLPSWLIIMLFMLFIITWLPLGKIKHAFVGLILVVVSSYGIQLSFAKTRPMLTVFDVGHGLAALLTDGKHHILYDTGYAANGGSAYKSYIGPSLRALNIAQLDALILSHKDNDHSGGLNHILADIPVKTIVAGRWFQTKNPKLDIQLCQVGYKQTIGAFAFEAIYPNDSSQGNNNDSCVLKVTSSLPNDKFSILLTGDIEKNAEYSLAEAGSELLQSDILLVPHHGSNSSSSYPFLKQVDPDLAIYSTERFSRYNLPSNKVVSRYLDFAIPQIHTGCYGQINYDLTDKFYDIERDNHKIWRLKSCEVLEK